MQRRKGTHRTHRLLRNRRARSNRSRTYHSTRRSTHRSKRIICNRAKRNRTKRNRTKGGNYDTDVTTQTRELVPMKSKGVVVAMPGYVFSAEEYVRHMEDMDRQGSD